MFSIIPQLKYDNGIMMKELRSKLYLDSSRTEFASDIFNTVQLLVADKLKGSTSHRRLLLGQKGVGKTALLNAIQEVIALHFSDQIICVFKSYDPCAGPIERITDTISARLGYAFNATGSYDRMKELEQELTKQGKYLVVIADDFQNCFRKQPENVRSNIADFYLFGEARGGRIHCIICGNSNILRQLCFGKLPEHRKPEFPAYEGYDFNSTKFPAVRIYPFLQPDDFKQVIYTILCDEKALFAPELYRRWYLTSGGYARILHMVLPSSDDTNVDPYTISSNPWDNQTISLSETSFYYQYSMLCPLI